MNVWWLYIKAVVFLIHFLESSGSFQIGEHLDDVFGHRGRSGQMVTSGNKSVLIGGPVDGKDDTIGGSVRVRSAWDGADIFIFRSDLLLVALFFYFNAVLSLVTELVTISNWLFTRKFLTFLFLFNVTWMNNFHLRFVLALIGGWQLVWLSNYQPLVSTNVDGEQRKPKQPKRPMWR